MLGFSVFLHESLTDVSTSPGSGTKTRFGDIIKNSFIPSLVLYLHHITEGDLWPKWFNTLENSMENYFILAFIFSDCSLISLSLFLLTSVLFCLFQIIPDSLGLTG